MKPHTQFDLQGNIPAFIPNSDGKLHDVNVLGMLVPKAGALYVMDRAYLDFERCHCLHLCSSFFVLRAMSNTKLRRLSSRAVDRRAGFNKAFAAIQMLDVHLPATDGRHLVPLAHSAQRISSWQHAARCLAGAVLCRLLRIGSVNINGLQTRAPARGKSRATTYNPN